WLRLESSARGFGRGRRRCVVGWWLTDNDQRARAPGARDPQGGGSAVLKERHQVFVSVRVGLDGLVVAAAQITTIPAAELLRSTAVDGGFWRSLIPFAVSIPLMLGVMAAVGLYRPRRDRSFLEEFLDIVKAGCFGWGLFI